MSYTHRMPGSVAASAGSGTPLPAAKSRSAVRTRLPWWLWVVTAVWIGVGVQPWLPAPLGGALPDTATNLLFLLKSAIECGVFLWAAGRAALGPRLRQALRLTAGAYAFSGFATLVALVASVGAIPPMSAPLDASLNFATYALGLAGVLRMPMFSARPGGWWKLALDIAASVLGLGAVMIVTVTVPQMQGASDRAASFVLSYGAAQTLMLAGVTVLVLRGVARPSARAFWLFVAGIFGNLLTVGVAQLELASTRPDYSASAFFALITSLCSIWAGEAFRHDPVAEGSPAPAPSWFVSLNPLPMLATLAVAGVLTGAARAGDRLHLLALTTVMMVQVILLVARLFLTSRENALILREEAEHERLRDAERLSAVGRLAGGIAHWFNNLLTTVLGHAELSAMEAGLNPAVRSDLASIRDAANRAAQLTGQLLAFSGRQMLVLAPVDLAEVAGRVHRSMTPALPPGITLSVNSLASIGPVRADARLIESVMRELVANAAAATERGGSVSIRIWRESLASGLDGATLPARPGDYAAVEVADTGSGIAHEILPFVFDPFYTTKPTSSATGLGLAAVRGIVAAHRGGLTVDSAPGRGTRITFFLPLTSP
jgi:signal transduction histidine kinase